MLDNVFPPGETPRIASKMETGRSHPAAETVFAALRPAKAVVVAVSGGPDSVALMLMAADWAQTGLAPPLFVATVDHGLRQESYGEAQQVGLWAHALGLPHRLLTWEGDKPRTRIQERARQARYDLLCAYAVEVGADYLITAHHADDQAETILFRLLRGSGLRGLGGMAVAMQRQNLVHLRPLLDWAKDDLIALCQRRGQAFFEDPSNRNPAYARTKLRILSSVLSENGLDRTSLLRLGNRLARADAALQSRAAALAASLPNTAAAPGYLADISSLRGEPEEILARILDIQIRAVSGKNEPLRLDRLESIAVRLHAALLHHHTLAATLGGVALHLDQKTYLSLQLERQRRRGRNANV